MPCISEQVLDTGSAHPGRDHERAGVVVHESIQQDLVERRELQGEARLLSQHTGWCERCILIAARWQGGNGPPAHNVRENTTETQEENMATTMNHFVLKVSAARLASWTAPRNCHVARAGRVGGTQKINTWQCHPLPIRPSLRGMWLCERIIQRMQSSPLVAPDHPYTDRIVQGIVSMGTLPC